VGCVGDRVTGYGMIRGVHWGRVWRVAVPLPKKFLAALLVEMEHWCIFVLILALMWTG